MMKRMFSSRPFDTMSRQPTQCLGLSCLGLSCPVLSCPGVSRVLRRIVDRLHPLRRFPLAGGVRFVIAGIALGVGEPAASAAGVKPSEPASVSKDDEEAPPPPLSLRSIFHPKDRYAYVTSLAPIRIVETAGPKDLLLSFEDDGWQVVDDRGNRSPWAIPQQISDALTRAGVMTSETREADSIDDSQAKAEIETTETDRPDGERQTSPNNPSEPVPPRDTPPNVAAKPSKHPATDAFVRPIRSTDHPWLVRHEKSLYLVSLESADDVGAQVQLIARDASDWKDVTLDPSGRQIGYTVDGDLYVRDVNGGRTMRLTDDQSPTRLDGRLDWTYQEEIYGRGNFRGFWFSPDGDSIAYLTIETSDVPVYQLGDSLHPRNAGSAVRYPKVGDPIPMATLSVQSLRGVPTREVVYANVAEDPRLITGVWWTPESERLLFAVSDREQTYRELNAWSVASTRSSLGRMETSDVRLILREDSPAWVEPPHSPHFLSGGDFLWRTELSTGRGRVLRVDANGATVMPLTPANFHVRELLASSDNRLFLVTGVNMDKGAISGSGSWQGSSAASSDGVRRPAPGSSADAVASAEHRLAAEPGSGPRSGSSAMGDRNVDKQIWNSAPPAIIGQHVFELRTIEPEQVDAENNLRQLTQQSGWHSPTVGRGFWMDVHSTADQPPSRSVWNGSVREFELGRSEFRGPSTLGSCQRLTLRTRDDHSIPALLWIPEDRSIGQKREGRSRDTIDPSGVGSVSQVPAIVEIYGGPQAAVATDRWHGSKRLYRELMLRRGVATLVVDNRSSVAGGVGRSWPIAGRFGFFEARDTADAADDLVRRFAVDPQRIGLTGWSFGGYLTALTMTRTDRFAAGIAGGSVTQWTEYDAFYTERYMGRLDGNEDRYRQAGVIASADRLQGELMLVHGEIDDNVHPSGTLRLAAELQKHGLPFDLMIYPGSAHAVHSPAKVWHLRQTMDRFWQRTLAIPALEAVSGEVARGPGVQDPTRKNSP